jgi:prepilin-type N-terminal cleavage/methylation domain-containing protein
MSGPGQSGVGAGDPAGSDDPIRHYRATRPEPGSTFLRRGLSLPEALIVLALIAIVAAVTLPCLADLGASGRTAACARQMAAAFQALRWRSVAENRAHGLFFSRDDAGWVWYEVTDGNGNGLRTSEIGDGTDRVHSGPHRIEERDGRVSLGFPPGGSIPQIPPRSGTIEALEDPVKFGRSNIVSFTPLGASSSGTLYLTDRRHELYGVVLFGPTVRVRVWHFDRRTEQWTL